MKLIIAVVGLIIGNLFIYSGFRGKTHIAEHFIVEKMPHLYKKIPLAKFLVNLFIFCVNAITLFFLWADTYIW